MKYLIFITVSFFIILSANGNVNQDTISNIQAIGTRVDTVRFVNDTAKLATQPKVSYIVYAEKDSVASILKDFILPIVMLLLGVGIDRGIVWINDRKKIKKIGKRWITELRSLLTPIQRQKYSFSSFIKEYCVEEDLYRMPNIADMRPIDGSKFSSLSKEDLYEYLEDIKGVDCDLVYRKITNIVSNLESTYSQLLEKINEFKRKTSGYVDQYNAISQNYRTLLYDLESYAEDHKIKKEDLEELYRLFIETFNNSEKPFNVFKSKNEFIEPSKVILMRYKANPDLQVMFHELVRCLDCIEGLKNEKIYIKTNFETAMGIYDMVVNTTKEVLKTLDSKK